MMNDDFRPNSDDADAAADGVLQSFVTPPPKFLKMSP
jgi:hypothetical protein